MPTISKPFCSTIEVHIFTRRGTLSILELDVRGTLFGKTSCSRLADIGHSSRGTPKFDEEKCAYYKQFILILIRVIHLQNSNHIYLISLTNWSTFWIRWRVHIWGAWLHFLPLFCNLNRPLLFWLFVLFFCYWCLV